MRIKTLLLLLMFMISSCAQTQIASEGQVLHHLLSSTVKIKVKLYGKVLSYNEKDEVIETQEEIGWVGTGVVVSTDFNKGSGQSMIMSAAHVVDTDPIIYDVNPDGKPVLFVVMKVERKIELLDGTICNAEFLHANAKTDIGTIVSGCAVGSVAQIASLEPDNYENVVSVGAPLGFHPKGIFAVSDGRFLGHNSDAEKESIFTFPAASGQSGSGVFHNGKIIAIVSKKMMGYEHLVMCGNLNNVIKEYNISMEMWNGH